MTGKRVVRHDSVAVAATFVARCVVTLILVVVTGKYGLQAYYNKDSQQSHAMRWYASRANHHGISVSSRFIPADSVVADAEVVDDKASFRSGMQAAVRSTVAVHRTAFSSNQLAVWTYEGSTTLLADCAISGGGGNASTTITPGDALPPGTVYTDVKNLTDLAFKELESGKILPLNQAPPIFLEAGDPAFTALRKVCNTLHGRLCAC